MPLQSTRREHLVFKPDIKNQQLYLYNPGEAGFVGARVWNRILSPSKVRTSCGGGLLTRALTAKAVSNDLIVRAPYLYTPGGRLCWCAGRETGSWDVTSVGVRGSGDPRHRVGIK